jgi:phage-related protein
MKKLFNKVKNFINKLFQKIGEGTKQYVPIAIKVVEAIKAFMATPVDDVVLGLVKASIPGTADDVLIDKVKKVIEEQLPKLLIDFKMLDSVSNITDPNEQLNAIMEIIKESSPEAKASFYQDIAKITLMCLSDGKLTLGESALLCEYLYQNQFKK